MFNTVVFSKNRAAQLDLFLRSLKRFYKGYENETVNVLYTFTSEEFMRGYELLKGYHPDITYHLERLGEFKGQFLSLLNPEKPYTQCFVDDNVFKKEFSVEDKEFRLFCSRGEILSLSLRMYPGIVRCYSENNRETPPPPFVEDGVWDWRSQRANGDWGYPMSVDGNIYRSSDFIPLAYRLSYPNPNYLEGYMANHPLPHPYLLCYQESCVLNVPANKVQDANTNLHGNISAEFLNAEFLQMKRIKLDPFVGLQNVAPHQEVNYEME